MLVVHNGGLNELHAPCSTKKHFSPRNESLALSSIHPQPSTPHSKIKFTVPPLPIALGLASICKVTVAAAGVTENAITDTEANAASHVYHEPYPLPLLILLSFLFLLPIFGHVAQTILCAGLLGQILLGVIFGTPIGGWLDKSWEEAWVALGYVGLLGLVFEGESSTYCKALTLQAVSLPTYPPSSLSSQCPSSLL